MSLMSLNYYVALWIILTQGYCFFPSPLVCIALLSQGEFNHHWNQKGLYTAFDVLNWLELFLKRSYCISIKNYRLYQALLSDHRHFKAMVVSSLIDRFRESLLYYTIHIGL